MPRKPNIDPSTRLEVKIPESVRVPLDLLLFSELENRIPQGKYQEFFVERIKEYFSWRRLDLSQYGYPQGYFVAGPKEMIEYLESSFRAQTVPQKSEVEGDT
jgi:ferredoxin-NADP reductase